MSEKFTVACVQNCALPDVEDNIRICSGLIREAASQGAQFVATPEYFSGLRTSQGRFLPDAFTEQEHPALKAFSELSQELRIWLMLGSLGVLGEDGQLYNRSYLLSDSGEAVARYDKIHLFDVELPGGSYKESDTIAPGNQAIVADTPWARLGLSVCYDLRFAALYRTLSNMGAEILTVPAAFTKTTGEAHWHVLQRARAIEHGAYVVAPCQYGEISGGGACFGHSLIVDPWGEVLADGGDAEGIIVADLDMAKVAEARRRIPALSHDRAFLGASAPQGMSRDQRIIGQSSDGVPIRSA